MHTFGCIDGAYIDVSGVDAGAVRATAQASFVLPGTRRSLAFRSHRAGYSHDLESWIAHEDIGATVAERREYFVRGGTLRVGAVRHDVGVERSRQLLVAAWEHQSGCIVTATSGTNLRRFASLMSELPFGVRDGNCVLALPVDARVRTPHVAFHHPTLGAVFVRPHARRTLDRVPGERGLRVRGGELYRARASHNALLFVSASAVVDIEPPSFDAALEAVADLEIAWRRPA